MLAQNLYYYPKPKSLIIGYLDPKPYVPRNIPLKGPSYSYFMQFTGAPPRKLRAKLCFDHDQLLPEDVASSLNSSIWGFPKIRGADLGVPIMKVLLYWGSPILGMSSGLNL